MEFQYDGHKVFSGTGRETYQPAQPSVVFIHGAGMDHTVWLVFERYFARHGYNVLALDLPGHGRSGGDPLPSIEAMADWVGGVLEHFDMSLGNGLSKIAGRVFRIGHLGDFNDLMLMATLSGVEMGLGIAGVAHQRGGVARALEYLQREAAANT